MILLMGFLDPSEKVCRYSLTAETGSKPLTRMNTTSLKSNDSTNSSIDLAGNTHQPGTLLGMHFTGANVNNVRLGIGSDSRIGDRFLFPGLGYGGSCFPKDVKALIYMGKTMGYNFSILDATHIVNQAQRHRFIYTICQYFDNQLDGRKLALWGLAFKPNTDDIREAPALTVMERLLDMGAVLQVYDPVAMEEVKKFFQEYPYPERIIYASSPKRLWQEPKPWLSIPNGIFSADSTPAASRR